MYAWGSVVKMSIYTVIFIVVVIITIICIVIMHKITDDDWVVTVSYSIYCAIILILLAVVFTMRNAW